MYVCMYIYIYIYKQKTGKERIVDVELYLISSESTNRCNILFSFFFFNTIKKTFAAQSFTGKKCYKFSMIYTLLPSANFN